MSVELLQMLSVVAYICCGIFAIVAIGLFFGLNIRDVIGELTGATERKAIEDIRQKNLLNGESAYQSTSSKNTRTKLTDKMTRSGNIQKVTGNADDGFKTAKISTQELIQDSSETTLLSGEVNNETTLLNTVVNNETTLLNAGYSNDTTILNTEVKNETGPTFSVDVDLGFCESAETID